jgi:hypothetical protein
MASETNTEIVAQDLQVGDLLYDRLLSGTHGSRVNVQWVRAHSRRQRTYVAGVEENSGDPVQLAYDNIAKVKVFR